MAYIGVQPTDTYLSIASQQITGTGSATYTLNYSVSDEESLAVFVNNVRQNVSSYTVSGTSLTLGGTISASDECWVLFLGRTVGTKTPAVGSVTNDMLAGSIATSKISNLYPYRNIIINGDMSIAQRGTSATGETTSGYVVCDRWQHNASGGTLDLTQNSFTLGQTDVPSLFKNYFTVSATTGGDNCGLWQKVEDVKSVQGTYTISWYAKGTNPNGGHLELALRQNFGSGGSADVDLTNYDFTLTSSWQRFSYTFTAPSLSGKTVGSSSYFRLYFRQPADDNTSNAWSMDFTGVQLEVGTSASDFEFLPYDVNLNRCYRYYQKSFLYSDAPAQNIGTNEFMFSAIQGGSTDARGSYIFPVEMRTAPTITTFNPFATNSSFRKPNTSTDVSVSAQSRAKFFYIGTSGSGTTALHGHFTADSEL